MLKQSQEVPMSFTSLRIRFLFPITLILFIIILAVGGCGGPGTQSTTTSPSNLAETTPLQSFTLAELSTFDGQDGRKAYIAVDGIVYDVTLLAEWGNKMHAGKFSAGKDYTEELKDAPHGIDKLLKAVQIGVIAE